MDYIFEKLSWNLQGLKLMGTWSNNKCETPSTRKGEQSNTRHLPVPPDEQQGAGALQSSGFCMSMGHQAHTRIQVCGRGHQHTWINLCKRPRYHLKELGALQSGFKQQKSSASSSDSGPALYSSILHPCPRQNGGIQNQFVLYRKSGWPDLPAQVKCWIFWGKSKT